MLFIYLAIWWFRVVDGCWFVFGIREHGGLNYLIIVTVGVVGGYGGW